MNYGLVELMAGELQNTTCAVEASLADLAPNLQNFVKFTYENVTRVMNSFVNFL